MAHNRGRGLFRDTVVIQDATKCNNLSVGFLYKAIYCSSDFDEIKQTTFRKSLSENVIMLLLRFLD